MYLFALVWDRNENNYQLDHILITPYLARVTPHRKGKRIVKVRAVILNKWVPGQTWSSDDLPTVKAGKEWCIRKLETLLGLKPTP